MKSVLPALTILTPTLALYILAIFHQTLPADQPILNALTIHHEIWRDFLAWFDINPVASLSMTAVLLALCLLRRQFPDALAVLLILPTQAVVIILPKFLIGRPRPEGALFGAMDSFPSGTAATAALILGLAIYFAQLHITYKPPRIALQAALTAAIIALGLFRILSGEHYPSDVLAGWLAGALSLLAIIALHRRLRPKLANPDFPH